MNGSLGTISVTGRLLGTVSFTCEGRLLALPPSSAALLAFLMMRRGKPIDRAKLVDVVEGGDTAEGPARRRVNTAVWRLRRLLEPSGAAHDSVLTSAGGRLAISPACDVRVDAVEFSSACDVLSRFDGWTETDARRVGDAVALYGGEFLGGVYTDWALAERGRLADLHLTALARLAQWFQERGEPERGLEHARAAVAVDPLREDLHRLVIQLYADAGLPQLAARQLEHCRTVLAEQLGIDPLPETVAVARVATRQDRPQQVDYDRAIRELERSYDELCRLEAQLGRSIQALRRSVTGR
jgi:DNA-binding SARP family transcriptional activator